MEAGLLISTGETCAGLHFGKLVLQAVWKEQDRGDPVKGPPPILNIIR